MMHTFLAMYRMETGVDTCRLRTMQMALSVDATHSCEESRSDANTHEGVALRGAGSARRMESGRWFRGRPALQSLKKIEHWRRLTTTHVARRDPGQMAYQWAELMRRTFWRRRAGVPTLRWPAVSGRAAERPQPPGFDHLLGRLDGSQGA